MTEGTAQRNSYAVRAGVKRPSAEDVHIVRRAIVNWPVDESVRLQVKRILNVSDCRLGVDDGVVLVEAPGDGHVVVIDIENEGDDWVSIPWG